MASAGAHRRVAVIGGGISGLAAAFRMRELAAAHELPIEVALFEAGTRLGGALETMRRDGFIIETGADSILSEKPAALGLAARMGLSGEQIGTQERYRKTLVVRGGRLIEIPEGFSLIAPTHLWPLLRSPLFSLAGKLRIAIEPLVPRRRADADESLGAFVRRRLGTEALVRLAQPLAGGIYTADPDKLSIRATLPRFVEMERDYGSVIRGLRAAGRQREAAAQGESGARWSLFVSFQNGIGVLVDALATRLEGTIRRGAAVVTLARTANSPGGGGRRWRLGFRGGGAFEADAVICAAPASALAPLLESINAELAATLADISYASAAVVNLAYRATDFPAPPSAFGFVVPLAEQRRIIAGSFSSLKYAGRAPAEMILARVFIGGALQSSMMNLSDQEMIATTREEFASLIGVTAAPALTDVRRWPDSMPQYALGHLERVERIERAIADIPGLEVAGAWLRGVGIPDCVASGERAAEAIFAHLKASA